MAKLITAIFGAGVFGSIVALRNFIGIILVMIVSTAIFKSDIVDYIKQSSKQEHEQKLAQINFETEKLKIDAEAKAQNDAKVKAEYDRVQAEIVRKEKEQKLIKDKLDSDRRAKEEQQKQLYALQQKAQEKVCADYLKEYRAVLICAIEPTNAKLCAPGYTGVSWLNYSKTIKQNASSNGCYTHTW